MVFSETWQCSHHEDHKGHEGQEKRHFAGHTDWFSSHFKFFMVEVAKVAFCEKTMRFGLFAGLPRFDASLHRR